MLKCVLRWESWPSREAHEQRPLAGAARGSGEVRCRALWCVPLRWVVVRCAVGRVEVLGSGCGCVALWLGRGCGSGCDGLGVAVWAATLWSSPSRDARSTVVGWLAMLESGGGKGWCSAECSWAPGVSVLRAWWEGGRSEGARETSRRSEVSGVAD